MAAPRSIRIEGVVTPREWDQRETPVKVEIVTAEFEPYVVADTPVGRELLERAYETVVAEGRVGTEGDGRRVIYVRRYRTADAERQALTT